jgi:hypothetical protein
VLFIQESCLNEGHEEVFYFTREGEFLLAIHEALTGTDPFSKPIPRGRLLEVSRMATFAASLDELTPAELQRFWTMYPSHSCRTLFISLDIPLDSFGNYLHTFGLDADEVLQEPWKEKRFLRLLADEEFNRELSRSIRLKKFELETYLQSRGIDNDNTDPLAVVDLGWRGSIQDNLAKVISQRRLDGYYFGILQYLNPQSANVKKFAFGPNENISTEAVDALKCQAAIEMLFNSPNGSVRGYHVHEDGEVTVNRVVDYLENSVYEDFTRHIQAGILDAAKIIGQIFRKNGLQSRDLRAASLQALKKLHHRPPRLYASAFFELNHNETFGTGEFIQRSSNLRLSEYLKALASPGKISSLREVVTQSGWPEAMLVMNDLGWLCGAYRMARRVLKNIR